MPSRRRPPARREGLAWTASAGFAPASPAAASAGSAPASLPAGSAAVSPPAAAAPPVIGALLAPPLCWSCRAPVPRGRPLCGDCRRGLAFLAPEPVALCGVRVFAPVAYEGPARDLVAALKFR